MKSMISASLAAVLLVAGNAQAATQNSQQNKMVTCNQQASGKTGDERASFMKQCLATKKTSTTHSHSHKKTGDKSTHASHGTTSHTHKKTTTSGTDADAAAPSAGSSAPSDQ